MQLTIINTNTIIIGQWIKIILLACNSRVKNIRISLFCQDCQHLTSHQYRIFILMTHWNLLLQKKIFISILIIFLINIMITIITQRKRTPLQYCSKNNNRKQVLVRKKRLAVPVRKLSAWKCIVSVSPIAKHVTTTVSVVNAKISIKM